MVKNTAHRFLKWSERYTKTDMTYLAKNGFWTILGQSGTFVFSFLLVWAFANLLTPETYGTYKFVLSIFAILSIATLPGMRTAIARAVAQGNSGTYNLLLKTQLQWGFLGAVGSLGISAYYYINGNIELAILFLITSIFVPFLGAFQNYETYLQGAKDFKRKAISQIIWRATISLITIPIIYLTDNLYIILATYLSTFLIISFTLNRLALKAYPPNQMVDTPSKKYGFHLSAMSALNIGAQHIDKILLWKFVGPAQLAVYFFALALPHEIRNLVNQVTLIAFPKFAIRHDTHTIAGLWRKIGIFILTLTIPVGLYVVTAPYLFQFFFPQYLDAVLYSQALATLTLFAPFLLIRQFFTARGDTKKLYTLTFIEPILLASLFLFLLPIYGIWGAIMALLLKEILSGFFAAVLLLHTQLTNN